VIESDGGDGRKGGDWKGGHRKEREEGESGQGTEELAFAVVDLTRGQMPSRVPLWPGCPKSPSLSLPKHRPLSPPFSLTARRCICLLLVDFKCALGHGETEDRHTAYNGPYQHTSITLSFFFSSCLAFFVPHLQICSSVGRLAVLVVL
jgi:hypothetical protein